MSKITKAPKITDAIPLVVKKAKFILLKSLCFTKVCWYINNAEKIQKPIQYHFPKSPIVPANIKTIIEIKCRQLESVSAFLFPSKTGIEWSFWLLSNSLSCKE